MRGLGFAVLCATTALLSACTEGNVCAGVEFGPLIYVQVRDQHGTPQALGSEVWFLSRSGASVACTPSDTLTISGGSYSVTYDIEVSKRYYAASQQVHNVTVPGDECARWASPPETIPVVITLLPGSPPVRSPHWFPQNPTLDRGHPIAFSPIYGCELGRGPHGPLALRGKHRVHRIRFDHRRGHVRVQAVSGIGDRLLDIRCHAMAHGQCAHHASRPSEFSDRSAVQLAPIRFT